MKKKIMIIMCSLLLATPFLSFAEDKPEPNLSAYEHANKNTSLKYDGYVFNNKANKEIRAKMLAEKQELETKKKTEEVQDKGEGQVKNEEPNPKLSAYEHANENARFKRSGKIFNNEANKKIRAARRAEKKAKKEAQAKKKKEEDQDNGYGQYKMKF